MRSYKSRCIIEHTNKVLLCKCFDQINKVVYYILPGGGIQQEERSEEAVRREIREELGSELQDLIFLKEFINDYEENGVKKEQTIFLFKGSVVDQSLYLQNNFPLFDHPSISAEWILIDDVLNNRIILHPSGIKELFI